MGAWGPTRRVLSPTARSTGYRSRVIASWAIPRGQSTRATRFYTATLQAQSPRAQEVHRGSRPEVGGLPGDTRRHQVGESRALGRRLGLVVLGLHARRDRPVEQAQEAVGNAVIRVLIR